MLFRQLFIPLSGRMRICLTSARSSCIPHGFRCRVLSFSTLMFIILSTNRVIDATGGVAVNKSAVSTNSHGIDGEIYDLFHNMSKKQTPFYTCESLGVGVQYRISQPLKCEIPLREEHLKPVQVGLWFAELTKQDVRAFECYAEEIISYRSWKWFGKIRYNKTRRPVEVSETDCRDMMKSRKAPNNKDHLELLGPGHYGTKLYPSDDVSMGGEREDTVINYFLEAATVLAIDINSTVYSAADLQNKCKASQGSCKTDRGVIVWDTSHIRQCGMKLYSRTTGLYKNTVDGGFLTLPKEQMTLQNIKERYLCSQIVGVSSGNVVITQERRTEFVDSNITTTSKFLSTVRLPRLKRNALQRLEHFDVQNNVDMVTNNVLNSRLQYLYDMYRKHMSGNLKLIEYEICNLNQRLLENLRMQAESGSPMSYVQALLGNGAYAAKMEGDVMHVWKCREVMEYQLLIKDERARYNEWPLFYTVNGKREFGFLNGLSHIISKSVINYTHGNVPNFYLDLGHRVLQLGRKSAEFHMETITPLLKTSIESSPVNYTWTNPGLYWLSEVTNFKTVSALIKEAIYQRSDEKLLEEASSQNMLKSSDHMGVFSVIEGIISLKMKSVVFYALQCSGISLFVVFVLLHCAYRAKYIEFVGELRGTMKK